MARTTSSADAASARKAGAESAVNNPNQRLIDALKTERQGYVQRGLPERVKQVDAQIKHYGGTTAATDAKAEAEAKAAAEQAEAEAKAKAAAEQAEAEAKAKAAAEQAEAEAKAKAEADAKAAAGGKPAPEDK